MQPPLYSSPPALSPPSGGLTHPLQPHPLFQMMHESAAQATVASKEKDVFHDTLLRYAGYANEFTEAGINSGVGLAKKLNPLAWITVFTYGFSDALNRSLNKHRDVLQTTGEEYEAKLRAVSTLFEMSIFHAIATWYGPVYTVIKPVGKLTEKLFKNTLKRDPRFWPSVAGLATIPFVPKVFDPITEKLLAHTYTPITERLID
jgi:hypothetical protein